MSYKILYTNIYDIVYDIVYEIICCEHYLWQNEISKHEWQVQQEYFDSVPSHVLSIVVLYIHIVEMCCIV